MVRSRMFKLGQVIPILQAKGLKVVAVQNPLTSLADDVAAVNVSSTSKRSRDPGRSFLGRHRHHAIGRRAKVAALVYVAAFAPDLGESSNDLAGKARLLRERPTFVPTAQDFFTDAGGRRQRFRPGSSRGANQGRWRSRRAPSSAKAFDEKLTMPPGSPAVLVHRRRNDRMIPPDLERAWANEESTPRSLRCRQAMYRCSRAQRFAAVIVAAAAAVK